MRDSLAPLIPLLPLLCLLLAATVLALAMLLRRAAKQTGDLRDRLAEARADLAAQAVRLEGLDATRAALLQAGAETATLAQERASLLTRIEERERHVADLTARLEGEFRDVSSRLLREAGDALQRGAAATFEKQQLAAQAHAAGYSRQVSELLTPMRDTLTRYEAGLREMRDQQVRSQGELANQITALARSAGEVQTQARQLATALTTGPRLRGRWGETTLRNVIEQCGLSPYCDFVEQGAVLDAESARKQPDLVVRLPGGRVMAIDSKVSLNDYMLAADATDDTERRAALDRHGAAIWRHVSALATRDYAAALRRDGALEFVVLFLPNEPFYTAALDSRADLFDAAFEKGVVIATPATLVAILKSVGHAWRAENQSENARKVAELAGDLYDALRKTGDYMASVGRSLGQAVDHYNSLVGNLEGRVLPRARRLADYEMPGTQTRLADLVPLDKEPRLPDPARGLLTVSPGNSVAGPGATGTHGLK